jgi:8-oxo-dGTP diphosphatase
VQHCSKCGGLLSLKKLHQDHMERLVCQSCQSIHYLDPKVSVCTIPEVNGKVLLVRRAINPGRGLWVFPGGFMDRWETVPEAAVRETREEVGLEVRPTELVGIYSYNTSIAVVIVYACEILGGELRLDSESTDVRAFDEAEIPWDELAFPSTRDALRDFFARRSGR